MELISILLSVTKWFVILFVLIIIWKLYEFLYIPWATRRRYSKYQNFEMIDKYHPMLGDIVEITNNQNENKFKFQHYIEIAQKKPDLDFYLVQLAQFQYVLLCSIKSFNEFEDLLPSKIDRHNHEGHLLKNVLDKSFSLLPSNSNWNERRKVVMKTIGINFASQYIQLMISIVDDWAKNLPKDTELDLNFELNKITFNIMTRILFGRDFDKMKNCRYVSPKDGSTTDLNFQDCYFRYARDEFEAQFDSKGKLIPFLEKYKLVDPYKTIEVNKLAIEVVLREFLETSTDNQSVYRQVLDSGSFTKEEVFYDTKLLLFAGFDTTSHGVSTMIYYLYKYPDTLSKLMDELKTKGVNSLDPNQGAKLKDLYESCDYLNYVIKEGLRIDPPGTGSMFYEAKEKVTISDNC